MWLWYVSVWMRWLILHTWLFIGSVFNWHIYPPLSSSETCRMCRFHVFRSEWDTVTRGLCVMTCSWIAWIAFVSAFTQPTWKWYKRYKCQVFEFVIPKRCEWVRHCECLWLKSAIIELNGIFVLQPLCRHGIEYSEAFCVRYELLVF